MRGRAWKGGLKAYADSKLANLLFTVEAGRRWEGAGITVNAQHPGALATRIWNQNPGAVGLLLRLLKLFLRKPEVGGEAVVDLLERPPQERVSGRYFRVRTESAPLEQARDREPGRRVVGTERSVDRGSPEVKPRSIGPMKPKVAVLGAGAMGSLFGSQLAAGGLDVTLIDIWREHVDSINNGGLRVVGHRGEHRVNVTATTDPAACGAADVVLVQCKAASTTAAVRNAWMPACSTTTRWPSASRTVSATRR